MRANEFVKEVNKLKTPVSMDRWMRLKQYYISMYHFYLLIMSDKGYISDPTDLENNKEEILSNLISLGISNCEDECGRVILTSKYVLFALKSTTDEESKEFLSILYEILRYKEYFIELDKQYENNSQYIQMELAVKNCSKVTTINDINYNRGVFQALVEEGKTVKEVTFRKELFDLAMEELGISKENYCDGMFVNGMSHEDEIYFAEIILNGKVKLNGKYAEVLIQWLLQHKWSNNKIVTLNSKGLYSYIYGTKSEKVIDVFEKYVDKYLEDGSLVMAYEDTVYIEKPIEYYNIPIGLITIFTSELYEDLILSTHNSFYGYNGECYTYAYIRINGYDAVGIPFKINLKGSETIVYDVSQVAFIDDVRPNSWFEQTGSFYSFEDDFYYRNPFFEGTTEYEMFNAWIYGNRGQIYKIKTPKEGYREIERGMKVATREINKIIGSVD